MLRIGKVSIGIVIPEDFERRVQSDDRAAAQLLVDGSDPIVLGAAQQLTAMRLHQSSQQPKASAKLFEVRYYYNPERRSAVNTLPGLIGVILTMTMVIFTSISLARERERGNLELQINTPITSNELMIGKILPYILIGFVQVSLVLFLGFMIFVMLPSILLSGFMFPFSAMPTLAQWIAEVLPMTHFVRLIRGVMLRGAGLGELLPELLVLVAFTFITLVLAIMRFHKRLD